jgi:hypothetical protein
VEQCVHLRALLFYAAPLNDARKTISGNCLGTREPRGSFVVAAKLMPLAAGFDRRHWPVKRHCRRSRAQRHRVIEGGCDDRIGIGSR